MKFPPLQIKSRAGLGNEAMENTIEFSTRLTGMSKTAERKATRTCWPDYEGRRK